MQYFKEFLVILATGLLVKIAIRLHLELCLIVSSFLVSNPFNFFSKVFLRTIIDTKDTLESR